MKNIFKIALLLIACSGTFAANNTIHNVILNEVSTLNTSTKSFNTDPKKKNTVLNDKNATDIFIENNTESYLALQLINVASDKLGTGYRSGGTTPAGFDCSGLMYSTFKKFDITLPRSSHEMAEIGTEINPENAKKGDLIFFINRGQHRINHVGMIVEVNGDEIKFIHSSTQGGVIISSLKESYYERTFKKINRIIE
ncbi:C40 family peptidase [Flavobacterium sp.]|jgi:cell wall-associated NlpC family hydrolase|uniref:C40 family peptidase n=1 Tax=Flavobacterium sp. TaxID=239 RepID=UPI0037C035E9